MDLAILILLTVHRAVTCMRQFGDLDSLKQGRLDSVKQ